MVFGPLVIILSPTVLAVARTSVSLLSGCETSSAPLRTSPKTFWHEVLYLCFLTAVRLAQSFGDKFTMTSVFEVLHQNSLFVRQTVACGDGASQRMEY